MLLIVENELRASLYSASMIPVILELKLKFINIL